MTRGRLSRLLAVVGLTLLLSLSAATVASAAVDGTLSAEYDDNASNDIPGREIVVSGTIEVTGESAVNPRIAISAGPRTILDAETVEIFIEGSRTVDFQRQVQPNAVVYTTDEIPSGTTLEVRYVVYPRGTNETNVTAGAVEVQFASSGARQAREFSTTANLTDSPQAEVRQLRQRVAELESENARLREQPDWRFRFFALIGLIVAVGVIGGGVAWYRGRDDNGYG